MPRRSGSMALPVCLAMLLALLSAGPASASAYQRPAHVELVSVASDGTPGDAPSWQALMTPDGRYVAFYSDADNLVPGDTNNVSDVFVRDRVLGTTTRVSVASDGTEENGRASWFAISADGRHVAFTSFGNNLVPGVTSTGQVYEHDIDTGVTQLVSQSSTGQPANFIFSGDPSVSADGRYVAFESAATNLVPGDTNQSWDPTTNPQDVFVRDTVAGTTERISVSSAGAESNGNSEWPVITPNGRYVTFESTATNLVTLDANAASDPLFRGRDVYIRDRQAGTTELVSVGPNGLPGAGASFGFAQVTPDGRYVAFFSEASDLVPNDSNRVQDVFERDLVNHTTERVSVSSSGGEANNSSIRPSISDDGRYVAFGSTATNLIPNDTNPADDIFVHDRLTGETRLASVSDEGGQVGGQNIIPTLSGDGRLLSFTMSGPLVENDDNATYDIYVQDEGPELGVQSVSAQRAGSGADVTGTVDLSSMIVSAVEDAKNDSGTAALGTELTNLSVSYRPEIGDLLFAWHVSTMPAAPVALWTQPGAGGFPGEIYTMSFTYGGADWVVSGVRVPADGDTTAPKFTLSKCTPACSVVGTPAGGIGTIGNAVEVSVPLGLLGGAGSVLTKVKAGVGLKGGPVNQSADTATLPDSPVLEESVAIGAGPGGGDPEVVDFQPASLADGWFSGTVPSVSSGPADLWVKVCLAGRCTVDRTPIA
ncbi:MAG: TolB family protein [Actinomycetota bacterium]